MAEHDSEPRLGSLDQDQSLESLDEGGRTGEEGKIQKKSWSGVMSSLQQNRPALFVVGAVGIVVGLLAYNKMNKQVVEPTDTSVKLAPPLAGSPRVTTDAVVAGLDSKTEQAAFEQAKDTNGTYVPPLSAPLPEPAKAAVSTVTAAPAYPNLAQTQQTAQQQQQLDQQEQQRRQKMQEKMAAQLEALAPKPRQITSTPAVLDMSGLNNTLAGTQQVATSAPSKTKLGYPMGTVWTALLRDGADTDRPGTVKAEIETGPFAGRSALCNFTWPSREYLNLECFAIPLDHESLPIKLVAVGADGMPTVKAEYNGRYIQRLGGQFLAAFPAAVAEGMRGSTTINSSFGSTTSSQEKLNGADLAIYAAGKATAPLLTEAQKIASEIKAQAKVPPMQIIGLMLAEDI